MGRFTAEPFSLTTARGSGILFSNEHQDMLLEVVTFFNLSDHGRSQRANNASVTSSSTFLPSITPQALGEKSIGYEDL